MVVDIGPACREGANVTVAHDLLPISAPLTNYH
jgi:hypothetical protein